MKVINIHVNNARGLWYYVEHDSPIVIPYVSPRECIVPVDAIDSIRLDGTTVDIWLKHRLWMLGSNEVENYVGPPSTYKFIKLTIPDSIEAYRAARALLRGLSEEHGIEIRIL